MCGTYIVASAGPTHCQHPQPRLAPQATRDRPPPPYLQTLWTRTRTNQPTHHGIAPRPLPCPHESCLPPLPCSFQDPACCVHAYRNACSTPNVDYILVLAFSPIRPFVARAFCPKLPLQFAMRFWWWWWRVLTRIIVWSISSTGFAHTSG